MTDALLHLITHIIWDQKVYQGRDMQDLNREKDLMIDKEDRILIETILGVIIRNNGEGVNSKSKNG